MSFVTSIIVARKKIIKLIVSHILFLSYFKFHATFFSHNRRICWTESSLDPKLSASVGVCGVHLDIRYGLKKEVIRAVFPRRMLGLRLVFWKVLNVLLFYVGRNQFNLPPRAYTCLISLRFNKMRPWLSSTYLRQNFLYSEDVNKNPD